MGDKIPESSTTKLNLQNFIDNPDRIESLSYGELLKLKSQAEEQGETLLAKVIEYKIPRDYYNQYTIVKKFEEELLRGLSVENDAGRISEIQKECDPENILDLDKVLSDVEGGDQFDYVQCSPYSGQILLMEYKGGLLRVANRTGGGRDKCYLIYPDGTHSKLIDGMVSGIELDDGNLIVYVRGNN